MSDNLTTRLAAFEDQMATQNAATLAAIAALGTSLAGIQTNTDLALENNAANTKALLAALGQTGACFPCPTPSIVVPPTSSTAVPVSPEGCQRSQWIVTAIQNLLGNMDTLQSFNVTGTFSVLNDAISQVVGAIAAGDTIPLPSFPETVQLVGTYVNYAGERAFSGVSLASQFAPLYGPLVTAVAISGNAEDAQAAYNSVIDASSASSGAKQLFKAVAYNALWSYAFDPTSTPDVSAFDGSACGVELSSITTCTTFGSSAGVFDGATFQFLNVPPTFAPLGWGIAGTYIGYTFEVITETTLHNVRLFTVDSGGSAHLVHTMAAGEGPYMLGSAEAAIGVIAVFQDGTGDWPFTIRICPPS